MAERRRTQRSDAGERVPRERRPAGEQPRRAARGRRPAGAEPMPADDELETGSDYPDEPDEQAEPPGYEPGLTARQAAREALRQIAELSAKPPEDITGVERTADGGWAVCVEVVEDRRIPSSSDVLATYEATVDAEGELMSFRRVRRYTRGRGDSGERP